MRFNSIALVYHHLFTWFLVGCESLVKLSDYALIFRELGLMWMPLYPLVLSSTTGVCGLLKIDRIKHTLFFEWPSTNELRTKSASLKFSLMLKGHFLPSPLTELSCFLVQSIVMSYTTILLDLAQLDRVAVQFRLESQVWCATIIFFVGSFGLKFPVQSDISELSVKLGNVFIAFKVCVSMHIQTKELGFRVHLLLDDLKLDSFIHRS